MEFSNGVHPFWAGKEGKVNSEAGSLPLGSLTLLLKVEDTAPNKSKMCGRASDKHLWNKLDSVLQVHLPSVNRNTVSQKLNSTVRGMRGPFRRRQKPYGLQRGCWKHRGCVGIRLDGFSQKSLLWDLKGPYTLACIINSISPFSISRSFDLAFLPGKTF